MSRVAARIVFLALGLIGPAAQAQGCGETTLDPPDGEFANSPVRLTGMGWTPFATSRTFRLR